MTRQKWLIPLLFLLLLPATARAEVVVIIRREAHSAGNYVRVCDIARVDGPSEQAKEVALTVLGPAPTRGEVQEFSRWDVENRLYEMGISARVTFTGNDIVRVRGDGASASSGRGGGAAYGELLPVPEHTFIKARRGMDDKTGALAALPMKPAARDFQKRERSEGIMRRDLLTPEARTRVGLAISNYIADQYKEKRPDIEVKSTILTTDAEIPYSAFDMSVVEAVEARVPGKALMRIRVKDTATSPEREVSVSADTEVYGMSVVAARSLPKGESLNKRDVAITRVKMEAGKAYLPPNAQRAVGLETKRAFRPGEVILAADAEIGDAVKRGSTVVVEGNGQGWKIQGMGKAQGSGGIDDVITVEDTSTKAKFQARIIGKDKVEIIPKKALGK